MLSATGSVTAANCKELAAKPDVDGFLVGGASLKVMKNPGRQLMSCSFFFGEPKKQQNDCWPCQQSHVADCFLPLSCLQPEFIDIINAATVKSA